MTELSFDNQITHQETLSCTHTPCLRLSFAEHRSRLVMAQYYLRKLTFVSRAVHATWSRVPLDQESRRHSRQPLASFV